MTVSTLVKTTLVKTTLFMLSFPLLQACQLPYLATGAYEQAKILTSKKPIKKVINDEGVSKEVKEKLEFAIKAQDFAEEKGLKCKGNFRSFVQLDRPYVTYLLIASKKNELKAKNWWFPIVGSFPYKGYFSKNEAKKAAFKLQSKDYDTYIRGVRAYSSLGWFKEPILSSMLNGSRFDLAETIFHECFHSTIFYKNQVEKNERLAVFFAHNILISFLKRLELEKEIVQIGKSWEDQILFSKFLKEQIKIAEQSFNENKKQKDVLDQIKNSYLKNLKPRLQVINFDFVFLKNLNNAKLVSYKTYFHNFEKLERQLHDKFDGEIFRFLNSL